ncbi:MAG: DUF4399 domain-containing protein [Leptospirales bacterium]
MKFKLITIVGLITLLFATSCKKNKSNPAFSKDAEVFIISPSDGETLSNPITVKFGVKGIEIAPAGSEIAHSGHHHLFIDVTEMPDMKVALPANDNIKHFGKGQTETSIELAPGEHTLQLVMGDKNHTAHAPPVISKKIKITVK